MLACPCCLRRRLQNALLAGRHRPQDGRDHDHHDLRHLVDGLDRYLASEPADGRPHLPIDADAGLRDGVEPGPRTEFRRGLSRTQHYGRGGGP